MTSAGDDQPGVEPHGAPGHFDDVAVSGARTSHASYQEDDREGHRSRRPSLSDADHAGAAKSGATASTSRPSLLAFSSTAGKGSSTSFTSATTVPWMPRSASSLSISSHRGGQDRKDSQHVQRHASSSLSTPRRIAHRSLPVSPTRRSDRGHNAMDDGEGSQQECNVVEVASTEDFNSDSKTGVELEDSMGSFPVDNIDDNEVPVDNASSGDEEAVIWPMKAEMDPRVALREQLRRSESARLHFDSGRTRADSYRSVKSATSSLRSPLAVNPWADEVSPAYENVPYAAPVNDIVQSNPVELDNRTPRRYFVLTSAGKPVFSSQSQWQRRSNMPPVPADLTARRDNDQSSSQEPASIEESDEMLTSLVGVIQAIISLYAVENDMIRYIDAGELKIAFYLKAPLYFVAVSDWEEPEPVLRTHLEYLYLAIISITTQSSINSIFKQRSNYDLRRLLAGTDNILNGLLSSLQETSLAGDRFFETVSGALKVVPFLGSTDPEVDAPEGGSRAHVNQDVVESLRDEVTRALRPPKKYGGILYALLVSHSTLLTLLRPRDHSIHPADLHILLNTISSTEALRTVNSESWIPICLPRFNSRGFLHAFISYFDDSSRTGNDEVSTSSSGIKNDLGLGIVLVTADKEGFFDMQSWKDHIVSKLVSVPASLSSAVSGIGQSSLYKRLCQAILSQHNSGSTEMSNGKATASKSPGVGHPVHHNQIPNILPIRHFWYKSKVHVQIFTPFCPTDIDGTAPTSSFTGEYATSAIRRRGLLRQYVMVREALQSPVNRERGDGAARLVYLVTDAQAVLGMSTATHELYICLPSSVPKATATEAAHALARWIRKNERKLFLTSASTL